MECARVGSHRDIRRAVHSIICYCCVFYTLFLFDTLGDAEGFRAAAWVLVVFPFAPVIIFICCGYYTKSGDWKGENANEPTVEMNSVDKSGTVDLGLGQTFSALHSVTKV